MANLLDLFNVQTPTAIQGLLNPEEQQKLQQKAATTGLINMAVGYLAQPKNQRFGSALPYLARAYTAGQEGAQGTYDEYLKNWQQQQQIKEFQRKQEEDVATQEALKTLATRPEIANNPVALAWLKSDPKAALKTFATPTKTESPFAKIDVTKYTPSSVAKFNQSGNWEDLDFIDKPGKPTAFIQNYEYAVSKGYPGSPEDWQKLNIITQQQFLEPYRDIETQLKQEEAQYKYGTQQVPMPKSVTMQDVSDTAKASGKTTQQVINDLKSRGITVRSK